MSPEVKDAILRPYCFELLTDHRFPHAVRYANAKERHQQLLARTVRCPVYKRGDGKLERVMRPRVERLFRRTGADKSCFLDDLLRLLVEPAARITKHPHFPTHDFFKPRFASR